MCSLNDFLHPPASGWVTTYETNGHLASAVPSSSEFDRYQSSVNVILSYKCAPAAGLSDPKFLSSKSAFVPNAGYDLWRKSFAAWNKHGIAAALVQLSENNKTEGLTWANYIARKIISIAQFAKNVRRAFHPHLMLMDEDMANEFAMANDWKCGPVRAIDWHHNLEKLAVAYHDDQVKIYSWKSVSPLQLKYALQKGITDLSWRPYTASTIAVASCFGVIIWTLDPTSVSLNPSPANHVRLLTRPNHSPVTCVQWSPCGKHLLSSSPRDSTMMLWNADTGVGLAIYQSRGGGIPLMRWAPDGWRIFSASTSKLFRVWERGNWSSDWWCSNLKRVVAACWNPEGTTLLIAVKDEPVIYSVTFANSNCKEGGDEVGGAENSIPIINLAPIFVGTNEEQLCVGGSVQDMVWDKTGSRLAVSFSSKVMSQELIAVFRTKTFPSLIVAPCGFIRGYKDEVPQCMAFKKITEDGSILTVCWSSGKLTHVRFLTSENLSLNSPKSIPVVSPLSDRLFSTRSPIPH